VPRPIDYDCIVANLEIVAIAWSNPNPKNFDAIGTRNGIDSPDG
jgi:hypothetical protein